MTQPYPSFTLIIESENLVSCKPEEIQNMFDSLLNQTYPIIEANEVIIGDNGLIPPEILSRISQLIPNLKKIDVERKVTYYQAKNLLATHATGDILVFCDSDCVYENQWLEEILAGFVKAPTAEIIAGETVIEVKGAYSLGIAINYMLHRQAASSELKKCKFYYLNNVAFKREFFEKHPIPDYIRIFRGTCSVHSKQIVEQGIPIWKNALAKAYHLPPQNLKYYLLRFLIMGHDHYWLDQLLAKSPSQAAAQGNDKAAKSSSKSSSPHNKIAAVAQAQPGRRSLSQRLQRKYRYWVNQFKVYGEEYEITKVNVAFAIPVMVFSQGLITAGRLITQFNRLFSPEPHWLYRLTTFLD
ncbi:MAG: glycosyltransferase [Leptolyngbya sp. RL_3_1]|nr:glycosyltransferase [Leptolyngbya sp. RL_3_1]